MGGSDVLTIVVKWSVVGWSAVKVLAKGCLTIRTYIDHMKFVAFMAFSFIIFLHVVLVLFRHCIYGCMFCMLLFNFVSYVFYGYIYVFLMLCKLCSVYSVFTTPTGTLRPPWLRGFRAFTSVVKQMPGYNSQRRVTAHTLLNYFDHSGFESQKAFQPNLLIALFYVLFVCKCVLYYCHRVSTQLQLTNISISIIASWNTRYN